MSQAGQDVATLLVVDDERRIHAFLSRALSAQGYSVLTALDGPSALEQLRSRRVDLVLLDLLLGTESGLTVLRQIRGNDASLPVIVVSAVTDVRTRVSALNSGAIDVVGKPFNLVELSARIRRHLPRGDRLPDRFVEAAGLRLDTLRRVVTSGHGSSYLSEREADVLAFLMSREGDVCTRAAIFKAVWGFDDQPDSNLVDVAVGRLRVKVPGIPLETIRGVGYSLTTA